MRQSSALLLAAQQIYTNTHTHKHMHKYTGMYGESEIRIVDLPTGAVRARRRLGSQWFGEGLVKVNDTLHQLTWRGPTGFSWSAQVGLEQKCLYAVCVWGWRGAGECEQHGAGATGFSWSAQVSKSGKAARVLLLKGAEMSGISRVAAMSLCTCVLSAHSRRGAHSQPPQTLAPAGSFRTPLRDGWGAALDGRLVVLSDGSSTLTWVDPARGWAKVKSLPVMVGSRPVTNLNEVRGFALCAFCPVLAAAKCWQLLDARQRLCETC